MIELDANVLTISGERRTRREQRDEGSFRIERASGAFARPLTLPGGVDADRIEASFAHGVLEVRIPKPEQRKPRRVSIGDGRPDTVEAHRRPPSQSSRPDHRRALSFRAPASPGRSSFRESRSPKACASVATCVG